jgi:hypothetical protein
MLLDFYMKSGESLVACAVLYSLPKVEICRGRFRTSRRNARS